MEDPDRKVDLYPYEWKSEREKPREPLFGPGLPGAIAYLVGFAVMFAAIYFAVH